MSCAVVLEMIRQIEVGNPSLIRAVAKAVGKDMIRVLPLSIVWAAIWFVLTVIEAVLSRFKKNDGNNDDTLTAQNAAATIANFRDFSFSAAFFDALKKGVRMVMFLIMPAIAWEDLGFFAAIKKGLVVLRAHLGDFGSGYALTYAAAGIVIIAAVDYLGARNRSPRQPTINPFSRLGLGRHDHLHGTSVEFLYLFGADVHGSTVFVAHEMGKQSRSSKRGTSASA
jgi:hypothetical protein